jgi:hypothetical protein
VPRHDIALDFCLVVLKDDVLFAFLVDVVLPVVHHALDALFSLLGAHVSHFSTQKADSSVYRAETLQTPVSCFGSFGVEVAPLMILHVRGIVTVQVFQIFHELLWGVEVLNGFLPYLIG